MRLRELERLQQREKERADKLEQELYAMKVRIFVINNLLILWFGLPKKTTKTGNSLMKVVSQYSVCHRSYDNSKILIHKGMDKKIHGWGIKTKLLNWLNQCNSQKGSLYYKRRYEG